MMNNQDVSISCEALLAEFPKKLYPKKSKILLPFTVVLFIVVPLTAVSAWLYWEIKESLILGILIFFTHEGFCLLKQSQAHTDHIKLIPWQAIEGFGIMRFQFQTIAIYQFIQHQDANGLGRVIRCQTRLSILRSNYRFI